MGLKATYSKMGMQHLDLRARAHVPGEGAARQGNLADRPEVGMGSGERKRVTFADEAEETREANVMRREELIADNIPDEVIDMEVDTEENMAEVVCRIKGRAVPRGRRKKWNEEVKKMEELIDIDKELGLTHPHISGRVCRETADHGILETIPGLIVDLACVRPDGKGWDVNEDTQYKEAKKKVLDKDGILLLGCTRHIPKGEKLRVGEHEKSWLVTRCDISSNAASNPVA